MKTKIAILLIMIIMPKLALSDTDLKDVLPNKSEVKEISENSNKSTSVNAKHQVNLGLRFQKTAELYWENGLVAQYQPLFLWEGRPYVSLEFITTRLGTAIKSNAIKQEHYNLGLGLRFRPNKIFQPGFEINQGFFRVDLENDIFKDLENTCYTLSAELLSYFNVLDKAGVQVGLGYHFRTPIGTLYPLYIAFEGVWSLSW